MALETTIAQLVTSLTDLRDAIAHLQFAVDARSLRVDHHLADRLEDRVLPDMKGSIEAALTAAAEAQTAAADAATVAAAGRQLMTCQRAFNALTRTAYNDLLAYAPVSELIDASQEHSPEWQVWTDGVMNAIDRCQQPMYDVEQALLLSWQEILERIGTTAISVQATNIGQQITVPEAQRPAVKAQT